MKHLACREAQLEDTGFQPRRRRTPLIDDARDLSHDQGLRGLIIDRLGPLLCRIKGKVEYHAPTFSPLMLQRQRPAPTVAQRTGEFNSTRRQPARRCRGSRWVMTARFSHNDHHHTLWRPAPSPAYAVICVTNASRTISARLRSTPQR